MLYHYHTMDINQNPFEKVVLPDAHREELESIGKEVSERQAGYTDRGITKERKEILNEVLGERVSTLSLGSSSSQSAQPAASDTDLRRVQMLAKGQQLQELVNIAAAKGPVEASKFAIKVGDPWLLDQFHDTLISFHDELVKRKKLKGE